MLFEIKEYSSINSGIDNIASLSLTDEYRCLNLHCNQLRTLNGLPSLILLEELNISSNLFESLNLSELSSLPNLKELDVSSNNLEAILNIPYLGNLRKLFVAFNNITCLDGLENLPNLEILDLRGNLIGEVEDMSSIQTLASIKEIMLANPDGRYSNPICTHPSFIVTVFDSFNIYGTIDGKNRLEWSLMVTDITPKFDKMAKNFYRKNTDDHSPQIKERNIANDENDSNRSDINSLISSGNLQVLANMLQVVQNSNLNSHSPSPQHYRTSSYPSPPSEHLSHNQKEHNNKKQVASRTPHTPPPVMMRNMHHIHHHHNGMRGKQFQSEEAERGDDDDGDGDSDGDKDVYEYIQAPPFTSKHDDHVISKDSDDLQGVSTYHTYHGYLNGYVALARCIEYVIQKRSLTFVLLKNHFMKWHRIVLQCTLEDTFHTIEQQSENMKRQLYEMELRNIRLVAELDFTSKDNSENKQLLQELEIKYKEINSNWEKKYSSLNDSFIVKENEYKGIYKELQSTYQENSDRLKSDIISYQKQINHLSDEINQKDIKLEESAKIVMGLKGSIDAYESEIKLVHESSTKNASEYSVKYISLQETKEQEVNLWKCNYNDINQKFVLMQQEMEISRNTISSLEADKMKSGREIEDHLNSIYNLKNEKFVMSNEKIDYEEKLEKMESRVMKLFQSLQDAKQMTMEHLKQIEELNDSKGELEVYNKELLEHNDEMKAMLKKVTDRCSHVDDQRRALKSEIRNLHREMEHMQQMQQQHERAYYRSHDKNKMNLAHFEEDEMYDGSREGIIAGKGAAQRGQSGGDGGDVEVDDVRYLRRELTNLQSHMQSHDSVMAQLDKKYKTLLSEKHQEIQVLEDRIVELEKLLMSEGGQGSDKMLSIEKNETEEMKTIKKLTDDQQQEISDLQLELQIKEKIINDNMSFIKKIKSQHNQEVSMLQEQLEHQKEDIIKFEEYSNDVENQLSLSRDAEKTLLQALQSIEGNFDSNINVLKKEHELEVVRLREEIATAQKLLR